MKTASNASIFCMACPAVLPDDWICNECGKDNLPFTSLEDSRMPGRKNPREPLPGETGRCGRCYIILIQSVSALPEGWAPQYHVDCGGFCPECALIAGRGDVELAQEVMDEYGRLANTLESIAGVLADGIFT